MENTTFSEYVGLVSNKASRLLLYPNPQVGTRVLTYYAQSNVAVISVHSCISRIADGGKSRLPLPSELFQVIRTQLNQAGKQVVIVGLDAYLSLLSVENQRSTFREISRIIDESVLDFCILLSSSWHKESTIGLLSNPKYTGARQVVLLDGESIPWSIPEITLVPADWCSNGIHGFSGLLEVLSEFEPHTDSKRVLLSGYKSALAGLSSVVQQVTNIGVFMRKQYGISEDLPEESLHYILTKSNELSLSPIEAMAEVFGQGNVNPQYAPNALILIMDSEQWTAFAWMLRNKLKKNTYLMAVLSSAGISAASFARQYIIESAIANIDSPLAKDYILERRAAIREMSDTAIPLISEFVSRAQDLDNARIIPWLNTGKIAEQAEILRRMSSVDILGGVPKYITDIYPSVTAYLSDAFSFDNEDLNQYFRKYRRLKVQNTITAEFVKLAYDITVPSHVLSRNEILKQYSDPQTALLVIDGMGAEYLPLLLALSKRQGLSIKSISVGRAQMPTATTPYNDIGWEPSRTLEPVKTIDNVAHNGESKHENTDFTINFATTLATFSIK